MVGVHKFCSTGEAYDASQCDDAIKDGDVLVVADERVVGILVEAWPVAISEATGEFHRGASEFDWAKVETVLGGTKDYSASFDKAVEALDAVCLGQAAAKWAVEFDESQVGGAFDGFTVTSDADGGL
jgi:hypothetical protein